MGCRTVANSSDFWSPHWFMKFYKARSMGMILWLYHSSVSEETKHLHSSSELNSNPFWKWDVAGFALLVIAFLQFSLADLFTGESVHWNPGLKHSRRTRYHFTKEQKMWFPSGDTGACPYTTVWRETKQILPSLPPLHIFLRIRHIPCGPGEVGLTMLQGLGIGSSFSNDHYSHHHQWQLCDSHTNTLQCILQTKSLHKKEDKNIINPRN